MAFGRDLDAEIEQHVPALRRFARRLTRDADRADDLVQDCLVRALSGWSKLRAPERLKPWLFSILHRAFLDDMRRSRRGGEFVALEGLDVVDGSGAHELTEVGDALRALDALPAEQRAVLLLVGVEDLAYAEAAEVLGVPLGTVMSRLSRARARLREILEGDNVIPLRRAT